MRKIKIYAVVSSDGYISRKDGDIDWVLEQANPLDTDYGIKDFALNVDIILMNRNYHLLLNCYDLSYPHTKKPRVIMVTDQKTAAPAAGRIEYLRVKKNDYRCAIERLRSLKKEKGGDIWLAGDNELIWAFLECDMIDEIVLTTLPAVLCGGAKLFPDAASEEKWHPWSRKYYSNGVIQVTYRTTDRDVN